ncbi:hypothetical protein BESB_068230 [Besnoitia besnoiti]|uniref:EF-hand domain-containing protein n=1 Tax=Besnoitia besnoiti TaxID=94643 RepID=A0A2A9MH93_BESBE|nr:hypothetical protein BESB_068230 [Besnoitia besnoiti]PFH34790.1 hypothetical protein BESB_068230 [Besnoitia besnoiti]
MRDSQRITHSCRYPCSPYYLYAVAACEPDGQSYDAEATQGEPDVADSHHRHATVLASEGPASGSQAQTIDVDTDGKIETEEQAYELMGKLIRMRKDNRARILYLSAAEAKGLLRAMETYVAGKDEKLKIIEGKQLELKLLGGKTLRLNKRMKTLSEMFPSLAALVDFRRYDWLRKSSNEEHDSESPGGSTETSSATEEDQAATVEATEKCIGHLLRNIKNDTASLARRRKLIATKESKAAEIHHTQGSAPPTSSGRAMSKMQLQTHATRIARAECDARKLEHRIQSRRYRLHKLREKMKLLKASAYQTHLAAGHTGTEPDRSAPLETKTTAPPLPKHLRHLEDVQRQDVASSDTERRMREPGFDGNIWRVVEENRTHCLASKELVHLTRPNELTQEDAHARTQKGGAGRARAGRLPTAILPNALAGKVVHVSPEPPSSAIWITPQTLVVPGSVPQHMASFVPSAAPFGARALIANARSLQSGTPAKLLILLRM